MSIQQRLAESPFDWLAAVILSWLIPLGLLPWVPVTYFTSLVLWAVPIVVLLPRFFQKSTAGGRRRRAMRWTVAYIAIAGTLLDLIFGGLILKFGSRYICCPVPAVGGERIPIEEFLFYILGGIAIVLVYYWADEHWLHRYTIPRETVQLERGRLLFLSGRALATGIVLFVLGVVVKWLYDGEPGLPIYFTFLIAVAFIPAMALFRNVKHVVNWQAFSFTTLYVLLTSCLWESTLALKRAWWGYKPDGMLGITIGDWGTPFSTYPIEALFVWIAVSFSCVLTYEAVKTYQYDRRPKAKTKLFGME